MIHTLEFRPIDSLYILISEDLMYRMASDQALDLSFFNPAYIYHNLNNRSIFNAIAYLEVKWAPIKSGSSILSLSWIKQQLQMKMTVKRLAGDSL